MVCPLILITVVSGLLWGTAPRALIDAAVEQRIALFTCAALIEELAGVLPRRKFAQRLIDKQLSIAALIERYSALTQIIEPATVSGPVSVDADDDVVLATALAARAELIVSQDRHLRNVKHFHRIPIVNATAALQRIIAAT